MSNTLKVCQVVFMYREVVLAKVMSWNSWGHPYRKLTNPTQSLTTVTGGGHTAWMGGGNVVESSQLGTSWHDSLLLDVDSTLWLETRLQTKEIKQKAMQCIPRSVNLCRQVMRFKETRVQEAKLCIQTRSHAMYTSFNTWSSNVFPRRNTISYTDLNQQQIDSR